MVDESKNNKKILFYVREHLYWNQVLLLLQTKKSIFVYLCLHIKIWSASCDENNKSTARSGDHSIATLQSRLDLKHFDWNKYLYVCIRKYPACSTTWSTQINNCKIKYLPNSVFTIFVLIVIKYTQRGATDRIFTRSPVPSEACD